MILRQFQSRSAPGILALVWWVLLAALLCSSPVAWGQSEADFPTLTGRVNDLANLLSAEDKASLEQQLEAHEADTSNQIVVVTVDSLDGLDVADYALKLGRNWGIGTEEKNNGVILLVAPNERQVRIEVGYGLEGALPDALAGTIVRNNILPSFRENEYTSGIRGGITAIIDAIQGEYKAPANAVSRSRPSNSTLDKYFPLFFIAFIGVTQGLRKVAKPRVANAAFPAGFAGLILTLGSGNVLYGIGAAVCLFALLYFLSNGGGGTGSGRRRGGYVGGSGGIGGGMGGGGGFSGGGGGFGGGGASGSW